MLIDTVAMLFLLLLQSSVHSICYLFYIFYIDFSNGSAGIYGTVSFFCAYKLV